MADQRRSTRHHRLEEMRQRVNLFMSKLSDRDTEAMAAAELESIARGLTADALPPFVSAIGETRLTDKTPLRRHSLRLLSFLAQSLPPAAITPHIPRIISAALRRLRDPDSSVRAALVEAVRSLAAVSSPSNLVTAILRPLVDALLHEQDLNSQSASAHSLSTALDETKSKAPVVDTDLTMFIHRLLPRLVKLARSPAFKAKPALLNLIGSAVAAGGTDGDGSALQVLVPCLMEHLASEEWSVRKAAAEALICLALAEGDRLVGLKPACLASFDARRFDKVKIVRDKINRLIEVWKKIPDSGLQDNSQFYSNSQKENSNDGGYPLASVNSSPSVQSSSPFSGKVNKKLTCRSPSPIVSPVPSSATKICRSSNDLKPNLALERGAVQENNTDWRIEVTVTDTPLAFESRDKQEGNKEKNGKNGEKEKTDVNGNVISNKLQERRVLFEKNRVEKKVNGMNPGNLEIIGETGDEFFGQMDNNLCLIRMQLGQIENQQSSLLELLQKFIGSSQTGIHSLEARVQSLELIINDISRNFASPSVRAPNSNLSTRTQCCSLLPGTDFLTSKFWKRTNCNYSSRCLTDLHDFRNRDGLGSYERSKQKHRLPVIYAKLFEEIDPQSRGSAQFTPKRLGENVVSDTGSRHVRDG